MKSTSIYRLFLLGLFIVCLGQSLLAQEYHTFYKHYGEFKQDAKEKLFFRFENLNFVKNNEYKGSFAKGATYPGYVATPKLVYYPVDKLRFEAGIRLQHYSGLSDFTQNQPVFSIHYQANPKLALILGSLNQDDNHHLHEAIFEPQRFFMDKGENGIQVLYKSDRWKADAWLNWEQFIFDNDPFQEVFTFGVSAEYQLNEPESVNAFSIPVQVLFTHKGGEIDTSDAMVQTIRNLGTGLSYKKRLVNSKLTNINADLLYFQFTDNSSFKEFLSDKGHGFHFRLGAQTKYALLKLGYWHGNKFNSSRGSALFQSSSLIDRTYFRKKRYMLTGKYRIQKDIAKGILIGGQVDAYFDIKSSSDFSYAASVFLRLNGEFFLKKLVWR